MWTNVHLNCHLVWETVLWTVTAIWQDDENAESVAIHQSGQTTLREDDTPESILTVALGNLLASNAVELREGRDG